MAARDAVGEYLDEFDLGDDEGHINEQVQDGGRPVFEHFLLAEGHEQHVAPTLAGFAGNDFRFAEADVFDEPGKLSSGISEGHDADDYKKDGREHNRRIFAKVETISNWLGTIPQSFIFTTN